MNKTTIKKIAIVTGASSGIGEEIAKTLQQSGWEVYAGARRMERMEALRKLGVITIPLDLNDEISIKTFVNIILKSENQIDLLINNAGYGSYGPVELVPISEGLQQFQVNLFGLARLTQLILPKMRENRKGTIVNVSSIGGSFGEPHGAWYHATKFALEGFSDSLRMELKQFNINVVIVKPGAILTEWSSIARKNLVGIARGSAYEVMVNKHADMLQKYDGNGSKPSIIAELILKISSLKNPKTRYAIGSGAKVMLILRSLLPDKLFDSLMLSLMK